MTRDEITQHLERWRPALKRIAYRITRSQEDAADILQEVWIKLWQKPPEGEYTNVLGLLSRYVRFTARDVYRRNGLRWRVQRALGDRYAWDAPRPDRLRQLEQALQALSPESQYAVWAIHVEGEKRADVAADLGLTENQLRWLLQRDLRQIPERLLAS